MRPEGYTSAPRVSAHTKLASNLSQVRLGLGASRLIKRQMKGILMALYEHTFLVRQDAAQTQVDALVEQYKGVLSAGGAKVEKVEQWGAKSLTFRIKKNRKAYFVFMNINGPHQAVAEMERQMSISEDVIRYMTIAVEALEEGPSAQMRRRDDRRERDDSFGMEETN
jgi:small subunit ribosomal protein S6